MQKTLEWLVAGVVICLERGADLHMAQMMPLPLTVSCFSKIQIGFTFLVLAHPSSPRQRAVKRLYVRVRVSSSKEADGTKAGLPFSLVHSKQVSSASNKPTQWKSCCTA